MKTPVRHRRYILGCAAVLVLLGVIAFALYGLHRPKVYEGGASVMYPVGGEEAKLLLSFSGRGGETGEAMEEQMVKVMPGDGGGALDRLYVYSEQDAGIRDAFLDLVESVTVSAKPEEGAMSVELSEPVKGSDAGGNFAYRAQIGYYEGTGTNRICWEIRMKNKDVIRLENRLICQEYEVEEYSFQDTPLETLEQLQALLDRINADTPADTVVTIQLPAVTYEGGLDFDKRAVILYGSVENGKKTTFTGTVRVNTREPYMAEFYDLAFEGDGGAGIISTDALYLTGCDFTGLDTGVQAKEGSWVYLQHCTFENNGIGFEFDSRRSTFSADGYSNNIFRNNEIGVRVIRTPGDTAFSFTESTFEGNGTDVEDPNGLVTIQ